MSRTTIRLLVVLGASLLLACPVRAAEAADDDEPTELEKTVRRLSVIVPDEKSIDYLASIDPRTGRPKNALPRGAAAPRDGLGNTLGVIANLGKPYRSDDGGAIYHLGLSADGRMVATGHCSGMVQLYDACSGRLLRRLRTDRGFLSSFAFSPDGKLLATAGGGWRQVDAKGIYLWDLRTGRELASFGAQTRTRAVAFAADGSSLVSGGLDGQVHVWDPATGKELRSFAADKIGMLAFAPDGRTLATVSDSGTFSIYDPATGKHLRSVPLEGGRYGAFAVFAPDGRRLAVGGQMTTGVYDLEAGKLLPGMFPGTRRASPFHGGVPVSFSPDGKTLACADSTIRLFEAATGRERDQFRGSRAATLAYAPNGKTLISGDDMGRVLIWDTTSRVTEDYPRAVTFSARELDALGKNLAGADAAWAYTALLTLGAVPREPLWLLRNDLEPPAEASPQRIKRLIADLDAEQFDVRQRAGLELTKLGDWSVAPLRRALAEKPPLEMKRRIERLLQDLDPSLPNADRLLALHAVDLLERIGTADAWKILERLADGAAANPVTPEAKAALKRLGRR